VLNIQSFPAQHPKILNKTDYLNLQGLKNTLKREVKAPNHLIKALRALKKPSVLKKL
jgi:hypothetical protein